jgi:hypothetical protein
MSTRCAGSMRREAEHTRRWSKTTIGFTVILFRYRLVDKCLLLCWRSYHRIAQSTQQHNQIKTTENAKMASKGG